MMFIQSIKYLAVILITIVLVIYPFGKFFYVPALKTAIEVKVRAELEREKQQAKIIIDDAISDKHKETDRNLEEITSRYNAAEALIEKLKAAPPVVKTVYIESECAVDRKTVEEASNILCDAGLMNVVQCDKKR